MQKTALWEDMDFADATLVHLAKREQLTTQTLRHIESTAAVASRSFRQIDLEIANSHGMMGSKTPRRVNL